jgi:hypothetical protein
VKYNLDGTIALSGNSYIMYFYLGEVLARNEDMDHSTAVPIRVPLIELVEDQVVEITFTDLVQKIEDQLNKFVFHPNLRDLVVCNVLRDSSTDELKGIEVQFGQYQSSDSTIPVEARDFSYPEYLNSNLGWSYNEGSFTTNGDSIDNETPAVALLSDKPISINDGELIVDFSSANDANIDWRVGLSRYVPDTEGYDRGYWPYYMTDDGSLNDEGPQPGTNLQSLMFADYLVCRVDETLKICHTAVNSSDYGRNPTWLDVVYGNDDVPEEYNLSTNASSYTKVKFECSGQQIKITMLEADDTPHVLYSYDSTNDDTEILKPINQSCWTMYPVLSIFRDETTNGQSLVVETFIGCDNIVNHNITDVNNSWFQSVSESSGGANLNDSSEAFSLETRPWNNESQAEGEDKSTYNIQVEVNGSGAIDLLPQLITQPSVKYVPTPQANTKQLLGFPSARMEGQYTSDLLSATTRIRSSSAPKLLSTKTMFVRLENFTQECANARMGNRSKIIAHLPRFDGQVETGRIFHQPNERVYLDLNNSEPLRINSFDISFCYTNEQYATNLTGQSVVVLHFKEKSK